MTKEQRNELRADLVGPNGAALVWGDSTDTPRIYPEQLRDLLDAADERDQLKEENRRLGIELGKRVAVEMDIAAGDA